MHDEKSWRRSRGVRDDGSGIMEEASRRRSYGEESWRRSHRTEFMEENTWTRNHGGGSTEKASWADILRRTYGGGLVQA